MRSFLIALLSTIFILIVFSICGLEWLTKRNVDPIIEHHIKIMSAIAPEYQDDNDFLRTKDIFEPSRIGRSLSGEDAGPIFNQIVHWMPSGPNFSRPPIVPTDIQDLILRFGRNWSLHISPFKVFFIRKRVNLKIFENIARFSYWNVEDNGPIKALISDNVASSPEILPSVDSLDLIALCKLRLIEGIFNDAHLAALKDVRKLVELLLSTENFRLELTALAILEAEHTAYELFVRNNWIKPKDWTVIDSNTTRRASRAIRATKGLLRLWTPLPILRKIFLTKNFPIGFCAAVGDALSQEFALLSLLAPQLPFERDFSQNFSVLEEIWARAKLHCHLSYFSKMKLNNNFKVGKLAGGILGKIPYSRKLFGLSQSAGQFEGFKDYSQPIN